MSFDSLAQQMYEAAIIENLNKLRHFLLGRITWEAAKCEIEAFNNAFSDIDEDKLSSIIVSQMLFTSSDKNNLAFEFYNVLNIYLLSSYPDDTNRSEEYDKFRDAARQIYTSHCESHELPPDFKSRILDFLKSSIYSMAAKDGNYELDSPTDLIGL